MTAYYNEHDPFAAQWLRNLISAGHIAPGIVDERPIQDVEAFELTQYTQCHFFAGIGVWSHALRRAGWSDDRPIWTGSCPCQPFSNAGKQQGFDDERHLWPYWKNLIEQCRPSVVIGEQVASALDWLDLVQTDLEEADYAFGASDLCAAGFQGAHIRQRLYFVGLQHTASDGRHQWRAEPGGRGIAPRCCVDGLADTLRSGAKYGPGESLDAQAAPNGSDGSLPRQRLRIGVEGSTERLADDDVCGWTGSSRSGTAQEQRVAELRGSGRLADDQRDGQHRSGTTGPGGRGEPSDGSSRNTDVERPNAPMFGRTPVDWLFCRDGKWRPVEPGTFPLVDAAPSRVGRLRAFGNALDAETATAFCEAVRDICDGV